MAIPTKLYVARSYVNSDEVRGTIIDASKDHTKAFQDKKARVDNNHKYNKLSSLELENVPTKGFSVVQKYTYFSRECYFCIYHPAGFEFYISVQNMSDLIANNNIINGAFVDEMYFDDKMQLINSNTKAFAKMQAKEEQIEKNKSTKENLKCGSGFVYGKNNEFYYCGKVHALSIHSSKDYAILDKSQAYDLVFDITKGVYSLCKDISIYDIQQKVILNVKTDIETEIKKANEYFQNGHKKEYAMLSDQMSPVYISTKSMKRSELKVQYEEISYDEMSNGVNYFCSNLLYMAKEKTPIDTEEKVYRVFSGITPNTRSGGYSGYSYYHNDFTLNSNGNFDYYCSYPGTLNANGTIDMDVDINEHQSFSTWRKYKSPFYPPTKKFDKYSRNYEDKKQLLNIDPKNTVLYIGRYYIEGK